MKLISVVVPCYNEQESLPLFYKEIERVRKEDFEGVDFEYIFVNYDHFYVNMIMYTK